MDTGVLYCDDNLDRLAQLPDDSVDLVYLDPPFFSNRLYEVIWGDEAEVRSFEDRWEGGIQHYIGWMRDRVAELHRVLKATGSLYLHCDPSASHYLKVMLDGIFGPQQFRNEIVWRRTNARSAEQRWPRVHDSLLFYGKSGVSTFHPVIVAADVAKMPHTLVTGSDGLKYQTYELTGAGTRQGETGLPWRGYDPTSMGRHWGNRPSTMDEWEAQGLIHWPSKGGFPRRRAAKPFDGVRQVVVGDVWTDIDRINQSAKEKLGYPTQKPEALLERILRSSSNENDVVLDPFCGCGTTVAVAERLKRRWIGIDISPTAIEIMRRRYWNLTREWPTVVNVPDSVPSLKQLKPFEFQNWIINAVNGRHSPRRTGDMGIDGYWWFTGDPVQVKQSEHVGRNVVDNFETALRREGRDTGYVIAFSFTKGAYEEVARVKAEGLTIKLVTVKEVLLQVKRPSSKLGPQPEGEVVPLPPMRKPSELPTAEELVASDQAATA